MWTPKYIHLKNLWAHVDTKYEFKNGVCTVIFGENRDDDDSDNNGAGKSTIFEAIAISLTGKSLRDIDKEVFINRHAESCEVEFYLENNALKSTLGIIRKFYRGSKSAKVEVYEDGERNAQLTSVNEANARIVELIGVTRDDLTRYFIISQDNRYQFFTAGDSEKKEVLNRITNADMINPVLDKLSADRKELASRSNELSVEVDKYEGKLEFFKEQRAEAKALDDNHEISNREERIGHLNNQIKASEKVIKEKEKALENHKKSADYLLIGNIPDVSELEAKRKKIRSKIKELEEQESEAEHIIKHLKADISGAVSCPSCGHKFMPESNYELSVEEAKQLIKETELSVSSIRSDIEKKNARIKKIQKSIDEAEEQAERARIAKNKANKIEQDIQDERNNIKRANHRISELKAEITDIKKNSRSKKIIDQCNEKIKDFEKKLADVRVELAKVTEELSMVDYWIYYMGKNGFSTYLANRAISIIEGITNSFLKRFHSSMSVEINGFKINKDGSVRDKIDVLAVYKGKYAQNFMGYSGGERGRIYLASILGIQHLINLSTKGKGLDLLLLDESLGALDSKGVVNICNILNSLGVTILMITQNVSNDVNVSNKVLVVREDEVSRIVK